MSESGQWDPRNYASEYQMLAFVIGQMLSKVITLLPVQVMAVTRAGSLAANPYVNVQPMLTQTTGANISVPHGIIYGMPCWRMQGGSNAAILDPVVKDIGLALFSYRPASKLIAADVAAPGSIPGSSPVAPGSLAQLDWSTGFYLGGWLCGAILQYILMNSEGITVVSPTAFRVRAPIIDFEATTSITMNSPANNIEGGGTLIDGKQFLPHAHIDGGGTGDSGPVA